MNPRSRPEADPEPPQEEEEGAPPTVQYKVVETSDVTAEELERLLNETTKEGWDFDTMHFAMRESSRRPSMAFLVFTREDEAGGG